MQEICLAYTQWQEICRGDALPELRVVELDAPVLDGIQAWAGNHINELSPDQNH